MTKTELYAAWQRWMHRNDIAADLDTIYELASVRILQAFLRPVADIDLDLILANEANVWLHAGLIELADLVQDDNQGGREVDLFGKAINDSAMAYSLANSTARPVSPYPT